MKRTAFGTSGFAAGWLGLAGLSLLLALAVTPAAWSEVAPQPPKAPKEKKAQAAAPAKKKEAPRGALKRRDPFRSLMVRPEDVAGGGPLPPGKRGLVIAQLNLNGIVLTNTGNIAVVTMMGRNRAYFLRARDELYDGYVSEITRGEVVFKERATDAFGRQYEREVVKQLAGLGAKR